MTDLDERITSTLREHAEGAVDSHRLLRDSVARGRRRRLRRRVVTATALALVGVLGVATVQLGEVPSRSAWTAAPPVPPPVVGVPGALADPTLVGTDPNLLHFGVDPARARLLTWRTGGGVEGGRLDLGGDRIVAVDLSTDAAAVERSVHEGMTYPDTPATAAGFDGRVQRVPSTGPGGQPGWLLRWQPVPGLYARVHTVADDDGGLREAVAALRLDEARRCATPLRLTTLPPDASLAGCEVSVIGFPDALDVLLTVARPGDQRLDVWLEYHREVPSGRTEGNRTIGDRAGYVPPQGGELELLGVDKASVTARFGWPNRGFTEADAAVVLGGARLADDLSRPSTWN
ncbi:hypothetical protein [Micromonospora coxensis]|uniref:LigA protein n=1 Tax=Micromonospora coxensis TaxID=356852 RepID=A0A1C5I2C3_9ACTN|nr:hypothetical protein [Micromonospora coxensis]SCG52357.1 hypothetical protein GA0070614_2111 [Micromonospora coxensis]